MGYAHIINLYKAPTFLETAGAEVYAMEKIHGTSAHINVTLDRSITLDKTKPNFNELARSDYGTWDIKHSAGGESHVNFVKAVPMHSAFRKLAHLCCCTPVEKFTVYGEAYGAKQQGMKATYGDQLKFVAFDVLVDGKWLDVPEAEEFCKELGIEFVHYVKGPNTLEFLNAQRDADSVQAVRNGMGQGKIREGIVVKPLKDVCNYELGERLVVKHKRKEFIETATPREVDPSKIVVLAEAEAIANEWVVEERLRHVLDKLIAAGIPMEMKSTKQVKDAMVEDVKRESAGEIVWSSDADKAIGKRTADLFKKAISNLK